MSSPHRPDVLLIGGGVAGLICLDRLVTAGYDTVLVDREALGTGQTVHSQGILHSGLKYLLHGPAPVEFSGIVERWRSYLESGGEIDLRGCSLLSKEVLVWSRGPWTPALLQRFAADGRPRRVTEPPPFLDGEVYALPEPVLDVFGLLSLLRNRHRSRIVLGEATLEEAAPGGPRVVVDAQTFEPRRVLLTAGVGNEAWLERLGLPLTMRRLPLHMVVARASTLPPFWGHGMVGQGPPELTVTSHGPGIWYLGGVLSEAGVQRGREEQIDATRQALRRLLPAIDLDGVSFETLRVDRAEPVRPADQRFEVRVEGEGIVWAAWPIKLVLAPRLADAALDRLRHEGIAPSSVPAQRDLGLPTAPVAEAPWA